MTFKIKKTISILCEGDTEYNYFTGFKEHCDSVLNIKCVPSNNGSYSIVLKNLKKISPHGTVARFAIIDFDRFQNISGEQKIFMN